MEENQNSDELPSVGNNYLLLYLSTSNMMQRTAENADEEQAAATWTTGGVREVCGEGRTLLQGRQPHEFIISPK